MGLEMNRLVDAISWSGSDVVLSLFLIGPVDLVRRPPGVVGAVKVVSYNLEDPDRRLGGLEVYEHDLSFDTVPRDLRSVVGSWLEAGIECGAQVAWFAFEGSFHFDHLLTQDIASSVYGIAGRAEMHLALDDAQRESSDWALQVETCREWLTV